MSSVNFCSEMYAHWHVPLHLLRFKIAEHTLFTAVTFALSNLILNGVENTKKNRFFCVFGTVPLRFAILVSINDDIRVPMAAPNIRKTA